MIEVVHVADTHLGYRQYQREERKADFRDAFTQVIDYAVENDVNAVVHGGDLFHHSKVDPAPLMFVVRQLKRLQSANIPFLTVVGNHDGQTSGPEWLDVFQEFNVATRLGEEPETVGDVAFYGIDHKTRGERKDLDYQFVPSDKEHAVLVAHGLFSPLSAYAEWDMQDVVTSSNIKFDAALLGDDHKPNTQTVKNTVVTYPGSTERTAADQEDDRGFNRVSIGRDGVTVDRELLDTRPFRNIDVELEEGEGLSEVQRRIDEYNVTDACVFVKVFGEGETFTASAVEEHALDSGAFRCELHDARKFERTPDDREIQFADPEESFNSEVRSMGLSDASISITDMIRNEDHYPDSRLKGETEDWLEDAVEDSPDDFVIPDDEDESPEDDRSQSNSNGDHQGDTNTPDSNEDHQNDPGAGDEPPTEDESGLQEQWEDHYDDVDGSENTDARTDGGDSSASEEHTEPSTSGQTGIADWK